MLGKKELVVCSVFGYIILTLLILLLRDKRRSTDFCTADNNCARFCCEDIDTCNERFIHENFNASLRHSDESREEGDDESGGESKVKILYGKPTCSLRLTTKHGYWHLNSPGYIYVDGDDFFGSDEFCFQDQKVEDEVVWDLYVCDSLEGLDRIFFYITSTIATVTLLVVVFIYGYFKNLRADNHGKISMYFMAALSITLFSMPMVKLTFPRFLARSASGVIFISFAFSLLCLSVMCFDIWWTFRNVRPTSDGSERFKFYNYFVFGLSCLLSLQLILIATLKNHLLENVLHWTLLTILFFFFATVLTDIVLLVLTSIKIFKMSTSSPFMEHAWLKQEKTRFFMYVQVFAIMLITGLFEILATDSSNRHSLSCIFISILRCYSALLAFAIFVLNDSARKIIFKRYATLVDAQTS